MQWLAPVSNNGATVTQYVVTPYRAGIVQTIRVVSAKSTTVLIAGLTNGVSYRFRVSARNSRGTSLPSDASAPLLVAGLPAHPTSAVATHIGPGQLSVFFTPGPANGSPISHFTATCVSPNRGAVQAASGSQSPIVVSGLTPGKLYVCKVNATNGRGTGAPSGKAPIVVA